jgi:hypothetical protein
MRTSAAPGATAAGLARFAIPAHPGARDFAGLAANLADLTPVSGWSPANPVFPANP